MWPGIALQAPPPPSVGIAVSTMLIDVGDGSMVVLDPTVEIGKEVEVGTRIEVRLGVAFKFG